MRRTMGILCALVVLPLALAVQSATAGPDAAQSSTPELDLLGDLLAIAIDTGETVADSAMTDPATGDPVPDTTDVLRYAQATVSGEVGPWVADLLAALAGPGGDTAWRFHVPDTADFYARSVDAFAVIVIETDGTLSCDGGFVEVGPYLYGEGTDGFAPNPDFPAGSGQGSTTSASYVCGAPDPWVFAQPVDGRPQRFAFPLLAGIGPTDRATTAVFFVLPNPAEYSIRETRPVAGAAADGGRVLEWSSGRHAVAPAGATLETGADGRHAFTAIGGGDLPPATISFDFALVDTEGPGSDDDDGEGAQDRRPAGAEGDGSDSAGIAGALILIIVLIAAGLAAVAWTVVRRARISTGVDLGDVFHAGEIPQVQAAFVAAAARAADDPASTEVDGLVVPSLAAWDQALGDAGLEDWTYRKLRVMVYGSAGKAHEALGPDAGVRTETLANGIMRIQWEDTWSHPLRLHDDPELEVTIPGDRVIAVDPGTGAAVWTPRSDDEL